MRQLWGRPDRAHIRAELLSAFLDNQVSPVERARVESHLHACADCRRELESLRRTVALLHALPRAAVPHAFTLSEARAGVRRSASRPLWLGGLARGLGAVTAVALVVVVAATVLRQPAATPSEMVARSAPTAALIEKAVEQPVAPAAVAPAPVAAEAQPESMAAADTGVAEPSLAIAQASPETASAQPELALAPAEESAPAARLVAPTETAEPATLAMAPPAPPAAATAAAPQMPSAKAAGMGGGAADAPVLPAGLLTPEPTPAIAPLTNTLPATARLVYADLRTLWALDGATGVRQLAAAETLNTPLISPDGTYIIYRILRQDYVELWGVPWEGGAPRLLLSERELPKDSLDATYTERRVQDVRWVPGRLALAVNVVRVPSPRAPAALPQVELWNLDVATGVLRYITPLGRAYRPFYAPDGSRFALLEYGVEADPQGRLTLYDADGSNRRLALTFPASPAKQSYDNQMTWLPDSSALLWALPAADPPAPGRFNGTTLYRVDASGQTQEVRFIDAYQVAWSPDATRLAYLRITSDTLEDGELYLANADGSGAQRYAAVRNGAFVAWSPDATHFLYQDNYYTSLGALGQAPRRLGTSVSFVAPRWISATQFISLHDTGTGWLLTLHGIDGAASGLIPLPREAMLDATLP